jgi:hypothetical protein
VELSVGDATCTLAPDQARAIIAALIGPWRSQGPWRTNAHGDRIRGAGALVMVAPIWDRNGHASTASSVRMGRRARWSAALLIGGRPMPNWAEQVTAIATAVSAIGLLSAIGAVIFAGQQAREARIGRQAEMAVEFFRRWSEGPMVETRRLVAEFGTPEALRDAMTLFIAENSADAYVLYRELDYFEQLGALEKHGGFDFELIRTLLGRRLIDRWDLWQPSIDALGGSAAYPMFERLVTKMRAAL